MTLSDLPASLHPPGHHRLYRRARVRRLLARHFNRAYYYALEDTVFTTSWLGVRTLKFPTDMWMYQELIAEHRPAVLLETGTLWGGSALFFATIFDALGSGRVVTVDISAPERPAHPRITYLQGSSTDPEVVAQVKVLIGDHGPVMAILDSDHARDHVLAELRVYGGLVTPGSYLVVEDTNVNGNPVLPDHGPGPGEAVAAFLDENHEFEIDTQRERFMLTSAPGGFLRRKAR